MNDVSTRQAPAKHPGGRPTKYDPRFVEEVDVYLATCGFREKKLPSKAGFAAHIGIDGDTLNAWRKDRYPADYPDEALRGTLKHPKFSAAIKYLETVQEADLI